jgi:hypothetical protein
MPFTVAELSRAAKLSLDNYARNNPIDQIATERPWLRQLMKTKKSFGGGKQYVIENLRYRYQSNFMWYYGDQQVSYNKRSTIQQVQYPWGSWHDGYSLNEDELFQNGITTLRDEGMNGGSRTSDAEIVQLASILDENNEVLRLGAEQMFSQAAHLDGAQSTEALVALDTLVSLTPSSGTIGGIAASNAWWQNTAKTGLTSSAGANYIIDNMETVWRASVRNGGRPNFIMAGSTFIDTFRTAAKAEIARHTVLSVNGQGTQYDPSVAGGPGGDGNPCVTGLHFKGVPILWNPEFADLDTTYSPATPWEKRCYFINTRYFKIRPAQGHDMIVRNPPGVYDRYSMYVGMTWKGAFTMNRRNAHAVLAVA